MTGRSPARLLAPLALVVTAVALFAVVSGGGERTSSDGADRGEQPTATRTPDKKDKPRRTRRTYTVQPGDTPSGIAESVGISTDELLELNPDVDPQALSPGQKLKVRE